MTFSMVCPPVCGPEITDAQCASPRAWTLVLSGSTATFRWWQRCPTEASSTPGMAKTSLSMGSRTTHVSSTSCHLLESRNNTDTERYQAVTPDVLGRWVRGLVSKQPLCASTIVNEGVQ